MAASMQRQYPSNLSVNNVVLGNLLKAVTCLSLFMLLVYSNPPLNLTKNSATAIQINILCIIMLEILTFTIASNGGIKRGTAKVPDGIKSLFVILISWILYYFITVIFGAPLTSQISETFHFSALLTVTTSLPCCLHIGPDWFKTFPFHSNDANESSSSQIICITSLLGAWLGAFPIPLDWDRPWQVWPISCVIGNILGYIGGLIISSFYLLYKCRQSRKSKHI